MGELTIVIGNKTYSSWSMRPWLALKKTGRAFREENIPLRQAETKGRILGHSGAGLVPVLKHELKQGPVTVWESLAIC
jgi:glutathione S-transferase